VHHETAHTFRPGGEPAALKMREKQKEKEKRKKKKKTPLMVS
jgi:hypothetical protein